jgi:ribonuclease HI/probable phosphoglycerate mutase
MDLQNPLVRQRLSRVIERLSERLGTVLVESEFTELSKKDLQMLLRALAEHMRYCHQWAEFADEPGEENTVGEMSATLYCDGASRGNPGPSGAGIVLLDEHGELLFELSRFLDEGTNNEAEYKALVRGLDAAVDLGIRSLHIFSDSELVVNQLLGSYRVRNPRLQPLFDEAMYRLQQFDDYAIFYVKRELNRQADRLANEAIDRGLRGGDRETYRLTQRE